MRLDVKNVSYSVPGHRLIDNISFASKADARTALLGANGAGKTLLLRLCHGLLKPTAGEIRWQGQDLTSVINQIVMVFQTPVLLSRSVRKNIEYAISLRAIKGEERRRRAQQALQLVGLADYADQQAAVMSGGQRRRIAIARAWALKPSVILLDEPTSNLDMESAAQVEDLILALAGEGVKIIFTSHSPAQAKRLCDEVIFLDKGKLVCHHDAQAFFSAPEDARVSRFINSQVL